MKFKTLTFSFCLILLLNSCKKTEPEPSDTSGSSTTTSSTTSTTSSTSSATGFTNTFCGNYKLTSSDTTQGLNGADNPKNPEFKGIIVPLQAQSYIALSTGLWCTPCGEKGVPKFDSLINLKKANIHFMSIQSNDSLTDNPDKLSNILSNTLYEISGLPSFCEAGGTYHQSPLYQNALLFADYRLVNVPAKAALGIQAQICGDYIVVKSKVKFISDYNESLKLQLFLQEDGIKALQATPNGNKMMTHNRIVRASLIPNVGVSGVYINKSDLKATAGQEFHFKYKFKISNIKGMNLKNLRVLGIIWKADDAALYDFINCNSVQVNQ